MVEDFKNFTQYKRETARSIFGWWGRLIATKASELNAVNLT